MSAAEISCYIKSFYVVFIYLDDICKKLAHIEYPRLIKFNCKENLQSIRHFSLQF